MSESDVAEIYENQKCYNMNGIWVPYAKQPWTLKKSMEPCGPPDEYLIPEGDWAWASNWRIDKKPGMTDSNGWEYASRMSRFSDTTNNMNRKAKSDKMWNDTARRRLWIRIMRREVGLQIRSVADIAKILPKVQVGLSSVHAARLRIEEIMNKAPDAAESEQMKALVQSVKKNISDILGLLDNMEKQMVILQQQPQPPQQSGASSVGTSPAVIKKLRNDVTKEELAIDRALYPHLSAKEKTKMFLPLTKTDSSSSSSSSARLPTPTSSSSAKKQDGNSFKAGSNPFDADKSSSSKVESSSSFNSNKIIHSNSSKDPEITGREGAFDDLMTASSSKPSLVKGGSAKFFKPIISNSAKFRSTGGADDGLFLDRSTQDLLIEQKLVAIDEATVMQEIIDDRDVEIKKIHKGLVEINEMFVDLSRIVKEQQSEIDSILHNVDESNVRTKQAFAHIVEAQRLQQSGNCLIS